MLFQPLILPVGFERLGLLSRAVLGGLTNEYHRAAQTCSSEPESSLGGPQAAGVLTQLSCGAWPGMGTPTGIGCLDQLGRS
jgi:hypothetical protein